MEGYTASQSEIGSQLDKLKTEEKSKADELRQLKYQFPDADIKDTDSEDTIALKIKQSNEKKVVIDLYTQTFGSFPTGMSTAEMNKKLAKKYKDYDKKKQALEIAGLEGEGAVKTAEERDKYISSVAQDVYSGNIASREDAKDLIDKKYPGYGDTIYQFVSDNYVSNKKKEDNDWGL